MPVGLVDHFNIVIAPSQIDETLRFGNISRLASEMLKNLTRANVVEIPYQGGVLAVQDLLGQQIHFIFSDALPAMQHIRAGKLRALCTTGA